jgi:hypothetical protein
LLKSFSSPELPEKLDTAAGMGMIVNERTELDQGTLLEFPTTFFLVVGNCLIFIIPPTVDTLASSLFRPRRDTLGCSAGFFYCLEPILSETISARR